MTARIALISATPAAIGPAVAGLAAEFPDADPWNLLDDKLLSDAAGEGGLTPALADRMRSLIGYAVAGGADGVLLTCSLYGPVTAEIDGPVPVLAPDAAAFADALAGDYRRILVLASFEAAMRDSVERFSAAVRAAGSRVEVAGAVAPDAFEAAKENEPAALLDALHEASRPHVDGSDAVLLAQYSLAPAAAGLRTALGVPVISGPHCAAAALKAAIGLGTA